MGYLITILLVATVICFVLKKFGPNLVALLLGVIFGIQIVLGALLAKMSQVLRLSSPFMITTIVLEYWCFKLIRNNEIDILYKEDFWHQWLYFIPILTAIYSWSSYLGLKKVAKNVNIDNDVFNKNLNLDFTGYFCCFFFFISSVLVYTPDFVNRFHFFDAYSRTVWWIVSLAYWVMSVLISAYIGYRLSILGKAIKTLGLTLESEGKIYLDEFLDTLSEQSSIDYENLDNIFSNMLANKTLQGEVAFYEIQDGRWVFDKEWLLAQEKQLSDICRNQVSIDEEDVVGYVGELFELDDELAQDFARRYLTFGEFHAFDDEQDKFVHYLNNHRINKCACCGKAEEKEEESFDEEGEWFCSDICRATEEECVEIRNTPYEQFLANATQNSLILIELPEEWQRVHKIVSPNSNTGHGFAAESANTTIDRIMGKDAKVVGDDNLKNGPDRLINGEFIQTKYCKTAARSIGAGFDGQNGSYRYYNHDGKPMPIEVPKDQYDNSLKLMKQKISEGKVPGVDNPDEATNLVRKGHLTYEQARNITKFGTFESITFDVMQGTIISAASGGISFAITASLSYFATGDKKAALDVALRQAGKTFCTTLTVFVATQQLHRIQSIYNALELIDVGNVGKGLGKFLSKGLGTSGKNATNQVLRGTIVSSVVLVAVTSGPDMVKLVRGRMSTAQFIKNFTVTSASVAGAAIGSIAGGAIGSGFGPAGMIIGRMAGGVAGGAIASFITGKIANTLMVEDKEIVLNIVIRQLEYLSIVFQLNEKEIDNLNANLTNILNQKVIEMIWAAKGYRKATANMILKPIVVGIVKQRPVATLDLDDLIQNQDSQGLLATA